MSGSNRRNVSETFGLAVIIAGAAFWAAMIWDISAQYSVRRVNAEHYASEYARSAPQYIARACAGAEATLLRECIAEQIEASRESERSEKDLRAQQDMADWAFWMMLVGAVTMVLTAIALWFVKGTLDATRQAVEDTSVATDAMRDANKIADEMGRAAIRAYMVVSPSGICMTERNEIRLRFEYGNAGQTPAKQITVELQIDFVVSGQATGALNKVEFHPSDIAAGPAKPWFLESSDWVVSDDLAVDLAKKRANVRIIGKATYHDVFGQGHVEPFGFWRPQGIEKFNTLFETFAVPNWRGDQGGGHDGQHGLFPDVGLHGSGVGWQQPF